MGGIDAIISERFRKNIAASLGPIAIKNIEDNLQNEYNITLEESMKEFDKFILIIKKIFGSGYKGLLKNILKDTCTIKLNDKQMIIHDKQIIKKIFEVTSDEDNRKILDLLISRSLTTNEIIKKIELPPTSTYRKIELLTRTGLLVEIGKEQTEFGRPSSKLITVYHQFDVSVIKNKIFLTIKISKNMLEKSTIIQALYNLS